MLDEFKNIYKFLASLPDNRNWITESDADKDNIITKNEFISYINASWDTNTLGTRPDNDIIGNFFSKELDDFSSGAINDMLTNKNGVKISDKNALSSKDIEDAEKTIARERTIIEQCRIAYNECPYTNDSEISIWISRVAELIEDHYADDTKTEALTADELYDIIKEATAQVESQLVEKAIATCKASSLLNDILKEFSYFAGHNLNENSDFMEELESYITNNKAGWKSTDVKTNITEFIRAYLNGDINGDEKDGEVLNKELFTYAVMNELKTSYTSCDWTNEDGSTQTVYYKDYPNSFNAIFEAYINEILNPTENSIKSHSTEAIESAISNFSFNGRIDELKKAVEKEIADNAKKEEEAKKQDDIKKLAQAEIEAVLEGLNNDYESFSSIIEEIVVNTIDEVIALELKLNEEGTALTEDSIIKIQNHVKEKILVGLEEHDAYNNGYDGDSLDLITRKHNDRLSLIAFLDRADDSTDDNIVLQATKDAHIDYCNWLATHGSEEQKDVVAKYVNGIKGAENLSQLNELFETLQNELDNIINPEDIKITWDESKIDVNSGVKFEKDIISEVSIDTDMTYSVTNCEPKGLNPSLNGEKLTFTSPMLDKDTSYTITVQAMYKGQPVEAKNITVTIKSEKKLLTDIEENISPFDTNESIKSILAAEEIGGIELSGFANLTTAKSNAKTKIASILTKIGEKLKEPSIGLAADRVDWAVTTTINYYQAAIEKIYDVNTESNYDNDNVQLVFEYKDASGKTCYSEDNDYFGQFTIKREKRINITEGDGMKRATNSSTGLRLEESWAADNTYTIGVNKKALLLKLNSFLEAFTR